MSWIKREVRGFWDYWKGFFTGIPSGFFLNTILTLLVSFGIIFLWAWSTQ